MARYITVTVGCDWADCDQLAPEDEGLITPMTVAIDGKRGREFLLCKTHRDTVDEMLLPLMQKGITATSAPKRNGTIRSTPAPVVGTPEDNSLVCRVEGCGRSLKGRIGIAQHVIKSHQFADLAAYEAVYGEASTTT